MSLDLEVPMAKPTTPRRKDERDRRASVRQPLSPEASNVCLKAEDGYEFPARVRDISAEGIGLLLNCEYAPGTMISVGLTNKTGLYARSVVLRANRIIKQEDGSYLVGGAFLTRLNSDELRSLLA